MEILQLNHRKGTTMKIRLLIIFMSLFFISCHERIDFDDLGNGYYLYWDDGQIQGISFPDTDSCAGILVGGKIDYYKYNKIFIVTKTYINIKPTKLKNAYHDNYWENRLKPFDGNLGFSVRDTNFKPHYEYFIIDKQKTKFYGPYIWTEYLQAMKILNLPDSLRLDR